MKKFLAIVLVLVLVLASVATVFAETNATVNNGSIGTPVDVPVQVKVNAKTGGDTVYSVNVDWDGMYFEYNLGSNGTWNPDPNNHGYDNTADGSWKDGKNSATITVTNHSNADVYVSALFANGANVGDENNGITATLSNNTEEKLESDVTADCDSHAINVSVAVTGNPSARDTFTLDTIKVKIAANASI